MADTRKDKQKKRREEAKKFDRPGYWMCANCGAHNHDFRLECQICAEPKPLRSS